MNRSLSRLTLAILAGCCALPVTAQETAAAGAQGADNTEVIQVRGIRGSLTQALATKRMSDSVLDSVSAEDIGDFPDKNIGDALQRIPGITVNRTYGEVDGVNIRGTAPEHSILLLNGQNVASTGWFDNDGITRSFNFELVSAEQIAGMDVYKSTEAHVNEGAMGGTIDLKTRKPLDMDAFTVFGSVEASKNTNGDGWEPGLSGLVSWKDDNEQIGILVAHSIEKSDIVRETQSTFGGAISWTGAGGGPQIPDTDGGYPVMPLGFASILFDEKRERSSSQLSFQYQASDKLLFSADYFRFELDNEHVNTALFDFVFINGQIDADSAVYNQQGVLVAGRSEIRDENGASMPVFNNTVVRTPNMISDVINLRADYEGDNWELTALVGRSKAKTRGLQSSTWWGDLDNKQNAGVTFDLRGPHKFVPDDPAVLLDHNQMKLFQEYSYLDIVRDNEIEYYQLDTQYHLDVLGFTSIDAGIKYQEQSFHNSQHARDAGLLEKGVAAGLTMADFDGGAVSGILGEVSGSGALSDFAVIDASVLAFGDANKSSSVSFLNFFNIDEEITSAYVKGNFEGENLRGNIGLRWVDTDVLSSNLTDKGSKNYSNLLPSVNLVYDIQDDLLLRFAASKTVSRPQYEQMKMSSNITIQQKTATVGSPDIDPYKSSQFDLGIEWYFDETSLFGATLFRKDISDYIEQTQELDSIPGCEGCLVTTYRNAGDADVQGLELQYQQDLGNGFGFQASYTYTDSELNSAVSGKGPVYGVSENSYNLSAYYEDELISARIAYNGRDEWRQKYNGVEGTTEPFKQVDASLVWHVSERIDVSLEAVNIFNEVRRINRPEFGYMHALDEFGARYFIGASFKM